MMGRWRIALFLCYVLIHSVCCDPVFKHLTNSKIKNITLSTVDLIIEDTEDILVERVPGTPSHQVVQVFLRNKFGGQWNIETDTFTSDTPYGKKEFTNIIVSHDSCPDCDFLVLAAHYDSKYFKEFEFVGAIDSAVPCAMLIDIARSLGNMIKFPKQTLGVKLIFFDGEEAFVEWTKADSIYGSRHLAEKWSKTKDSNDETYISKIDSFVLLDLIGAKNPIFYNYFPQFSKLFEHIASVEQRLTRKNIVEKRKDPFFKMVALGQSVEDDHKPFLELGVKVLHLIPVPFPRSWHTQQDDRASLDLPTIDALSKIIKVFVAEYLGL